MKLKLDENLGGRGADRLRAAGHDVATVFDQGLTSASDNKLIEVVSAEGRGLVTLDLDFSNSIRFNPASHAGVAVLRLPRKPSRADLDEAVETLVGALEQMQLDGQLWTVQRGRVRIYKPDW